MTPTDPAATGSWDQAPVDVTITTGTVTTPWSCPSTPCWPSRAAATPSRWSVADGVHHLVAVTLGLFDDADGLVQVTGSGLAAGQRVVVPGAMTLDTDSLTPADSTTTARPR